MQNYAVMKLLDEMQAAQKSQNNLQMTHMPYQNTQSNAGKAVTGYLGDVVTGKVGKQGLMDFVSTMENIDNNPAGALDYFGPGGMAVHGMGLLGMIAGKGAKTADIAALTKAKLLKAQGVNTDDIYKETKWWLDHPDKQPRFEIDDSASKYRSDLMGGAWAKDEMGQLVKHDDLYSNYPELSKIDATYGEGKGGSLKTDAFGEQSIKFTGEGKKGIAQHELQHAIQDTEGFATGGNSGMFLGDIKDSIVSAEKNIKTFNELMRENIKKSDNLKKYIYTPANKTGAIDEEIKRLATEYKDLMGKRIANVPDAQIDINQEAYNRYNSLAGESEARLVQDRLRMSMPERLLNPFYKNYDVPIENQIVKMNKDIYHPLLKNAESIETPSSFKMNNAEYYKTEGGFYEGNTPISEKLYNQKAKTFKLREQANIERFGEPAKITPKSLDYRITHTAPIREGKNTLDNMSDIYPDDVYNPVVAGQYYGHGGDTKIIDNESARIVAKFKNKPNASVTIYRAVPKGVTDINAGDWITINKNYADMHGKSWVDDGNYSIIKKTVKAKDIATDGNSLHEFGYSP